MAFSSFNSFHSITKSANLLKRVIPTGITGGSPLLYYPFWTDTKDYATIYGLADATLNGTTPPSLSNTTSYRKYASNSLYCSNYNCNMTLPAVTINSTVGFTVCFWFNLSSTSTNAGMLWTGNGTPFSTRTFIYYTGSTDPVNPYKIRINVNSSDNNIYSVTTNTWYFITLVQPANGQPYVLLNNSSLTNLTNYVSVNYTTGTNYHLLFGDPYVGSNYGGAIAYMNNFYFFNRALSASEITALYNQ